MPYLRLRPLRSTALLGAFLLLACLHSSTAQAGDFNRFGPYLGISGVYALPLYEDQLQDINPGLSVSESPGLNARLGLRLASFFAIEAQYEWIEGFDVDLASVGKLATFDAHNITGNLRFHIPIWRVDPYVLAGLGATIWGIEDGPGPFDFTDDGVGFAGRVGGGLDLYLTKHIVLNAEVTAVLTTRTFDVPTQIESLDNLFFLSISAGLVYRF